MTSLRTIFVALLLTASAFAQQGGVVVMGGTTAAGGKTVNSSPGVAPPPPLLTVPASLYGGSFNSTTVKWPPADLAGNNLMMSSCRLWDDGLKLGQIFTVSGPVGAHTVAWMTTPTDGKKALDNMIRDRCKKTTSPTAPLAPLKVIYTMGDTPPGAALAGAISPGSCGGVTGCCSPDVTYSCRAYDDNVSGDPSSDTDTVVKTMVSMIVSYLASEGIQNAWEIQNEADVQGFQCWNGVGCGGGGDPNANANVPMLKALVRRGWDMKKEIGCLTPTAVVYSWSPHAFSITGMFDHFLNTTITSRALTPGVDGYPASCPSVPSQTVHGYDVFDIMNWHADGGGAFGGANAAESLIITTGQLQIEYATRAAAGHPLPTTIICDECGYRGGGKVTTVDEAAGNLARRYILAGFLGYTELDWYQLDTKQATPMVGTQAGNAYDITQGWMVNSVLTPYANPVGTVYTETLTGPTGNAEAIIWDSGATNANGGYTCNNVIGGTGCTTVNVSHSFTKFTSLDGVTHSIVGFQVPASGKPICLSTGPC